LLRGIEMAELQAGIPVPTHTDEARELLAAGDIKPGDAALDVPPESMTDREMLAEMLIHSRNTRDAVVAFMEGVSKSPLGAMINGGKANGLGAFLG
jgi:hypothetical protein